MIKTQIQIPDELYHALKQVAERQEWSLAETLRRGAEYIVATYPGGTAVEEKWELPLPLKGRVNKCSAEQLKEFAQEGFTEESLQKKAALKRRR